MTTEPAGTCSGRLGLSSELALWWSNRAVVLASAHDPASVSPPVPQPTVNRMKSGRSCPCHLAQRWRLPAASTPSVLKKLLAARFNRPSASLHGPKWTETPELPFCRVETAEGLSSSQRWTFGWFTSGLGSGTITGNAPALSCAICSAVRGVTLVRKT